MREMRERERRRPERGVARENSSLSSCAIVWFISCVPFSCAIVWFCAVAGCSGSSGAGGRESSSCALGYFENFQHKNNQKSASYQKIGVGCNQE